MNTENRFSRITQPINKLVVLNAETTGTILLRQNALGAELINASVAQVKSLADAESLRGAMESQREFIKDVSEKVRSVTRENIETMRDARQDAVEVVKTAFSSEEAESAGTEAPVEQAA